MLLGDLYQNANKVELAKTEYQRALTGSPEETRAQALRGLVNIAITSKQYGEAEKSVREYLAAEPSDSKAHLLLGRLLAAQQKNDEALEENAAVGLDDAL